MSIKLAFIGAGSTIFMKNVVGDLLTFPALASAEIALMDIDAARLDESRLVAEILVRDAGTKARVTTHLTLNPALDGADFVVTAFQVGGYDPATIIDFKLPKAAGLDQTIGDTLGVAGIMRALRTVPELFRVALAMQRLCPDAWLMNYVNPMVMNCWALSEAFPDLNVMGLCHSVQNTVMELAHDLDMAPEDLRYRVAGVNHVAFFLDLTDTQGRDLYPALRQGYGEGRLPKPPLLMPRCPNKVRYEVMKHFGYFCTESSEHLAEYTPWFIKRDRPDLIENFGIPLDEYPKRCIEQRAEWQDQAAELTSGAPLNHTKSHEMGADIINAIVTDTPLVTYINMANRGQIPHFPEGLPVETPCLVDGNGVQPTVVDDIPVQLRALMQSQISVQELAVSGMLKEDLSLIYQAAKMDPHTAAELDLNQIDALVTAMLEAHAEDGMFGAFPGIQVDEWIARKSA
jgi:alpha-galactosidase